MFITVNAWAAFTAGIASFFSPCLLPLIPAYIMYLTGSYDVDDIKLQRKKALIQTLGFILGFTIVFMLLGVTASSIGKLFASNKYWLSRVAGAFIVFFGLNLMGILKFSFMHQDYRKQFVLKKTTPLYAIGMGMAFAFGWTPCFGPIIGAILASTAAFSNNVSQGVSLLAIYSMGMAVPFLLTAVFIDVVQKYILKISDHMYWLNKIAGLTLSLLGFLMMLGLLGPLVNNIFNL